MRHRKHQNKLVANDHRGHLIRNLAVSLIKEEKIKSTIPRCKALRPYIEKLVSSAREDSTASRRLVFAKLHDKEAVTKLFTEIAPRYKERPGGYTRVLRYPEPRVGDGATLGIISFV